MLAVCTFPATHPISGRKILFGLRPGYAPPKSWSAKRPRSPSSETAPSPKRPKPTLPPGVFLETHFGQHFFGGKGSQDVSLRVSRTSDLVRVKRQKPGHLFGAIERAALERIWALGEDHGLLETLDEDRKIYFDFDLDDAESAQQGEGLMLAAFDVIADELKDWDLDWQFDSSRDALCSSFGEGKWSAHLVLNCGHYFKGEVSWSTFRRRIRLRAARAVRDDLLPPGFLDPAVYGKNQNFKLPFQNKPNKSTSRIQVPVPGGPQALRCFLISHDPAMASWGPLVVPADLHDDSAHASPPALDTTHLLDSEQVDAVRAHTILTMGQECIPDGAVLESDPVYLSKSISATGMDYDTWLRIGMALHRTGASIEGRAAVQSRYFQAWWNLTQRKGHRTSIPQKQQEMRTKWADFRTDYGPGLHFLKALAAVNNPRLGESTAARLLSMLNVPDHRRKVLRVDELDDGRYLPRHTLADFLKKRGQLNMDGTLISKELSTVIISALCGQGKTQNMKRLIDTLPDGARVIMLSVLRSWATWCAKQFGFVDYQVLVDAKRAGRYTEKRLIVSVQSLLTAIVDFEEIDLLVIDESEGVFSSVGCPTTLWGGGRPAKAGTDALGVLAGLGGLIRRAKMVVCLEAYPDTGPGTTALMQALRPEAELMVVETEYKPPPWPVVETRVYTRDPDALAQKLDFILCVARDLNSGLKVMVACSTFKFQEMMMHCLREHVTVPQDFCVYNKNAPLPLGANVNDLWKDANFITFTPTISYGISFEAGIIDRVYAQLSDAPGCPPVRTMFQALHRARRADRTQPLQILIEKSAQSAGSKPRPCTALGVQQHYTDLTDVLSANLSLSRMEVGNADVTWAALAVCGNEAEQNRRMQNIDSEYEAFADHSGMTPRTEKEGHESAIVNQKRADCMSMGQEGQHLFSEWVRSMLGLSEAPLKEHLHAARHFEKIPEITPDECQELGAKKVKSLEDREVLWKYFWPFPHHPSVFDAVYGSADKHVRPAFDRLRDFVQDVWRPGLAFGEWVDSLPKPQKVIEVHHGAADVVQHTRLFHELLGLAGCEPGQTPHAKNRIGDNEALQRWTIQEETAFEMTKSGLSALVKRFGAATSRTLVSRNREPSTYKADLEVFRRTNAIDGTKMPYNTARRHPDFKAQQAANKTKQPRKYEHCLVLDRPVDADVSKEVTWLHVWEMLMN